MKRKHRGQRRHEPSLRSIMLEAARRAPPLGPAGDDDCELCRMMAGQEPLEVFTLPDGTEVMIHEVPAPGARGAPS